MATSSNPSTDVDIDALLKSLPACRRCRDCRRGCDTLVPKCRQCQKAGVDECMFFDHGRDEYLPRSYIAELVDHLRKITASNLGQPSPATSGATPGETTASSSTVAAESVTSEQQQHHEHYFARAEGSFRYLGAESLLVKSPRLQQAEIRTPVIPDDDDWELVWKSSTKNYDLVVTYLDVLQPLYPVLDTKARFLEPEVPSDLAPAETFYLNMVYAIACYLEPMANRKKDPRLMHTMSGKLDFHHLASEKYRCLAQNFFNTAQEHLEASTAETTIGTLRAVLLLAIYSLFDPKSGNIGQQVALSTRLALDLETRLVLQELGVENTETIRNMHSTIFSIENEIASTLDRPATFPEPEWDITFDESRPSDYLCSLYRLQHRFRSGDHSVKTLLPRLDEKGHLRPGLRMALHQTHFLLNPCWPTSWYLLEAAVSMGSIHVCFTPHWIYRAGSVLIQNLPAIHGVDLIQLYSNALVVLELSSAKWPATSVLRDSLVDLMHYLKVKLRPHWEQAGLQCWDVRI